MTNHISVSFWFQAVLHVTAYCTSCKKNQELPSGCPRKALSWSCCSEDSCRNCFSMTRTWYAEEHVWLQNPVKKAGCGNCLPVWPWTQNHILSLRNDPLFIPLLPTTDHEDDWHPTGAWKGLFTLSWIPCLGKMGLYSSPQIVKSQPL